MKRFVFLLAAIAMVLPASAQSTFGIGLRAGTLGPGADIAYNVSPKLNIRLSGSYFSLAVDEVQEEDPDIRWKGDVAIGAVGINADFHPFGGAFRLTGGININLFDVSAVGTPIEAYCFGSVVNGSCDSKEFQASKLGSLGAGVGYASSIAPYAGIGFGKAAGAHSRIGFLFDLGALYTGSPEVDLNGTGLLAPTAGQENEDTLNTGLESFQFYPVISLGLAIRL
jgi:hypothetical protein